MDRNDSLFLVGRSEGSLEQKIVPSLLRNSVIRGQKAGLRDGVKRGGRSIRFLHKGIPDTAFLRVPLPQRRAFVRSAALRPTPRRCWSRVRTYCVLRIFLPPRQPLPLPPFLRRGGKNGTGEEREAGRGIEMDQICYLFPPDLPVWIRGAAFTRPS